MKVKLIYPTDKVWGYRNRRRGIWYPLLTFPVLASYTPDFVDEIEIIDEELEEIDFDDPVDVVGITVMTFLAPRAYEIARQFKERGATVIMGGMHASALPDEAGKHADAIVIGEGEEVWADVLDDIRSNRLKPRYKARGLFDMKKYRPSRNDLFKKYLGTDAQGLSTGYTSINLFELTRGCTFNCEFCSIWTYYGGEYRHRYLPDLIDEVRTAKLTYRNRLIGFVDDNLYGNRRLFKDFLERIYKLNVFWTGQISVNIQRSPELLDRMADAGCKSIFVGFESVNSKSLSSVNKYVNNVDQYHVLMEMCAKRNILVFPAFIFGLDWDDATVFEKTLEFLKTYEDTVGYPNFSILTPLPGTVLYKRLTEEKRILDHDWKNYNFNKVVIEPKLMSREELQEGYNWIHTQFDFGGILNSTRSMMSNASSGAEIAF